MKFDKLVDSIIKYYEKLKGNGGIYFVLCWILGFPTLIFVFLYLKLNKSFKEMGGTYKAKVQEMYNEYEASNKKKEIFERNLNCLKNKNNYFNIKMDDAQAEKLAMDKTEKTIKCLIESEIKNNAGGTEAITFSYAFRKLLNNKVFFLISVIVSLPMYILLFIYSQPYIKFVVERLVMLAFVLIGVVVLVFTIIYISPTDPAASVLGIEATPEDIRNFREIYGLNGTYLEQLTYNLKKLVTFNLGTSFVGKENIAAAIGRKFPVTLILGFFSLLLALFIAIPAGIVSAIKQYSALDYILMFFALLGLSIPNFWLGMILILQFSINMGVLPASYQVGNWTTLIMPVFVFGTGMSATFARMTRSSMLEVCRSEYIRTARAKGLKETAVTFRHILKNALIPIVTVVGLQFAGTLGGAATTEKVFNIMGIGTYMADASMLPDIPVVLASVIYVCVTVSIATVVIDILYTFIDPRIKTRLKNY